MAETKPAETPEYNTGAANRTTPNGAKIILGWELNEKPVSSAFTNWLQYWAGAGLKWLYERFDDGLHGGGGDEEDLYIHAPAPTDSVTGGNLDLAAATALTTGTGGTLRAFGGDGAGAASAGGAASVQGGAGAGTGGGGSVSMVGGDGGASAPGGLARVAGGQGGAGGSVGGSGQFGGGGSTGTDTNGGVALLFGGSARGDGYSKAQIQVVDSGQGTGSTQRSPTAYLEVDGDNQRVEMKRPVVLEPAAEPTVGLTAGMLYADATTKKPITYDGSAWGALVSQAEQDAHDINGDRVTATSLTAFATKHTIPAGLLRVGSVIRIRAFGRKVGTVGTFELSARIGGTSGPDFVDATGGQSLGGAANAAFDLGGEAVVAVVGASGEFGGGGRVLTDNDDVSVTSIARASGTPIDTTGSLDVVLMAKVGSGDYVDLYSLTVDVT